MKKICLVILLLIIFSTISWFLRGELDHTFMNEGKFCVINTTQTPIDVVIAFPSGNTKNLHLKANQSEDFMEHRTGEGSIDIKVNGHKSICDSYVTNLNPAIILTITKKQTGFYYFLNEK